MKVEMSLKILILGDNAEIDRILKLSIENQPGWKAVGAMAGEEALAGSPFKHPPDVVISEISRIDASVIPSISAIRDKFVGSKILAVSDQRDSRLVLRIIHAGANGFMITDRAPEELAAAIRTIAAGGMFLSPGIAGLEGRRPS
jgi:DNA-binding NarL/FixJ family response regulator